MYYDVASYSAHVAISPEYPIRPPRFVFQSRNDQESKDVYDTQLKDVEVELNAYYNELIVSPASSNWLLSHQLVKAQMCFDVFSSSGTTSAAFGRNRRGKDRRRSIVLDPSSHQSKQR